MAMSLGLASETQGLKSRSRLLDSDGLQSRSRSRAQKLVSPFSGTIENLFFQEHPEYTITYYNLTTLILTPVIYELLKEKTVRNNVYFKTLK